MTSISLLNTILKDYQSSLQANTQDTTNTGSNNSSDSNSSDYGPSYLLDISQAAKQFLQQTATQSTVLGGSSTVSVDKVTLTATQEDTIRNILAKYATAPITDATLQALDNDLHEGGVAPEQLGALQAAKNFDPVSVFIDILQNNGEGGSSNDASLENPFGGNAAANNNSGADNISLLLQQLISRKNEQNVADNAAQKNANEEIQPVTGAEL